MKFINIIFFCVAMTSTLAFGQEQSYGGNVNLKGMGGQSVVIEGGNVIIKGMNGESVQTGDGSVNATDMFGQSVNTRGKAGQKRARDEDADKEEKEEKEEKED